jgi:hypothetical protein
MKKTEETNKISTANKNIMNMFIVIILMMGVLAIFYFLINRDTVTTEEKEVTQIEEVLLRDLDTNYPPTPKEVVKYYSELSQCFYLEEAPTDEQLFDLGMKALELYDNELASTLEEETYIDQLKNDVLEMKKSGTTISSFSTSSSTDVEYFTENGFECAGLLCTYTMQTGGEFSYTQQTFILRKDTEGHWKIYGWQTVASEEENGK